MRVSVVNFSENLIISYVIQDNADEEDQEFVAKT